MTQDNTCTRISVPTLIELKKALLANRDDIAAALESAVAELELCRAKCMELEGLIERGRLVLGVEDPKVEPLTLHAAMEVVLREHGDGLSAPELARELNKRHLYRPRKGGPVEPGQIHARAGAYQGLFARQQGRIILRSESLVP